MQLSRDGDTEKALKLLDEAQELDPSRIALYEQAAAMRHARGDLEGALAEVDAGLRQRSDHWGLLDLRGDVLRDLGRDKEAIESYRMCVSNMNPTGYWAPWLKLGQLQEKMGATSEARATYQEVLRVYPGSQEAQRRLSALDGG